MEDERVTVVEELNYHLDHERFWQDVHWSNDFEIISALLDGAKIDYEIDYPHYRKTEGYVQLGLSMDDGRNRLCTITHEEAESIAAYLSEHPDLNAKKLCSGCGEFYYNCKCE